MWKPYIKMIAEQIPAALHVLDRFRIMRNMNVAIDEVRRAEAAQMKRDGYEPILTKSRFLDEATDGQVIAINGKRSEAASTRPTTSRPST
jgi:transposase